MWVYLGIYSLSGSIWVYLGLSVSFRVYLGLTGGSFWFWVYLGLLGSIWVYLGLSGSLWVSLGLSGSIWVFVGLFGSLWVYLGFKRNIAVSSSRETSRQVAATYCLDPSLLLLLTACDLPQPGNCWKPGNRWESFQDSAVEV